MVEHLFPDFLLNERVYLDAGQHWVGLWDQVAADSRVSNGWTQPWFQPLPPSISEGNAIFSAVSHRLRRGIRVIQSAPTESGLEFVAYLDTFGGSPFDPNAIHELVISCGLSDEAARVSLSLIVPWVEGKAVGFDAYEAGLMASDDLTGDKIVYANIKICYDTGISPASDYTDEEICGDRRAA
jgi:hypothetical protein